jgi:hypothetical protein
MSLANAAETIIRDKSGRPIVGVSALDRLDYFGREEFSWTPVLGGAGGTSGQTYSLQSGKGCRFGGLVFWQCAIVLTAKGTITGNVEIQGMPYVPRIKSAAEVSSVALGATKVSTDGLIAAGLAPIAVFGKAAAAANSTQLVTADILDTTEIYAQGCFLE